MREIKFRQWDPKNKKFHYFGFLEDSLFSFTGPINPSRAHYPVSQYTGIEDSKGVEIYEGDIVTVPGLVEPFVISISPELGVFYNSDSDQHGGSYSECACEGDFPTVIGNIYENPELLTKPDED